MKSGRFFFSILCIFLSSGALSCKGGKTVNDLSVKACSECYTIILYPHDDAVVFGDMAVVGISVHPGEITKIVVSISSRDISEVLVVEMKAGRRWSSILNTKKLPDGQYVIRAQTFDSGGNSSEDSVRVMIKNTLEIAELDLFLSVIPAFSSFITPQNGQYVFGYFPVIGVSFHPARIKEVILEISSEHNEKSTYTLQATYVWFHMWNTYGLKEGRYNLRVFVTDEKDKKSQAEVTAVVSYSVSNTEMLLNIMPILYGIGITFPADATYPTYSTYLTYPIYITYPFEGTLALIYPISGMTLSRTFCSTQKNLCNVLGFYAAPDKVTSGLLFVDGAATKEGMFFPMPFSYPHMGTFVVSDWWGAIANGLRKLKVRAFLETGKHLDSQEVVVQLSP